MLNSSALYEEVFNKTTTGGFLLSPTPEGIILAVNDAFLKASHRRRDTDFPMRDGEGPVQHRNGNPQI